jgi:hypothetical protein
MLVLAERAGPRPGQDDTGRRRVSASQRFLPLTDPVNGQSIDRHGSTSQSPHHAGEAIRLAVAF